jgi:hypothetical protein
VLGLGIYLHPGLIRTRCSSAIPGWFIGDAPHPRAATGARWPGRHSGRPR